MEVEFFYELRVKLIKQNNNNEFEFLEFKHKFEDKNPIIAREKAFKRYQSYLDVILYKDNISDLEARVRFKNLIISENVTENNELDKLEINDNFGSGIGIFMIINKPIVYPVLEGIISPDEEIFIHGIGDMGIRSNDPNRINRNLESEVEYYNKYNYSTGNNLKSITFCDKYEWLDGYLGNGKWVDDSFEEPHESRILETPFNWSGFDKPYWWGNEVNNTENKLNQLSEEYVINLINLGESNQVEFKPALVYNFSTGKPGISVKGIIAKSIAAFLNSNGGFLFIGVSDSGQIQGLDNDFKLSEEKNQKDYFLLEFDQMLEHFLSFSIKSNVDGHFINIEDKVIFVVVVSPLKNRPVFLKGQDGKIFYVRGQASSRPLKDVEEIINYCIDRFNSNQ